MVIPKDFLAVENQTYDELMAILAWSFKWLALGKHPDRRHDGSLWTVSDSWRRRRAGTRLPTSVVSEVRGDWACYKNTLRLPGWGDKAGCCWCCDMVPSRVKEASSDASWRKPGSRLVHNDVMARILQQGKTISPIFDIPFLHTGLFRIDWLHAVDLGVAADFLGSFFSMCLPLLPGRKKTNQCKELWAKMQEFYRHTKCQSRFDQLKPSMLKKEKSKFPKMRGKAGEIRALIPFANQLGQELLGDSVEHEAAKLCASSFNECYSCLSEHAFCPERMEKQSRIFALQYVGLNALAESRGKKLWAVKPKFHMFLELTHDCSVTPVRWWTYRDEDFGGFMSSTVRRRGGYLTPCAVGVSCFNRFAALHRVPVL